MRFSFDMQLRDLFGSFSFIGDCAELFDYCNQEMIEAKVKLLLQMSLVLIWGMYCPLYSNVCCIVSSGQCCANVFRRQQARCEDCSYRRPVREVSPGLFSVV